MPQYLGFHSGLSFGKKKKKSSKVTFGLFPLSDLEVQLVINSEKCRMGMIFFLDPSELQMASWSLKLTKSYYF